MELTLEYTYELMTVEESGDHKRYDTTTRLAEVNMLHVTSPNYVLIYNNLQIDGTPLFTLASQADLEEWSDARGRVYWMASKLKKPTKADFTNTPVDSNLKTAVALTKPRLSNIPTFTLFAMGAAMSDGAKKYGRYNWRKTGSTVSVFYDAMNRHLQDWYTGEDFAKDSGIHHLAHLMADCAIMLDARNHPMMVDDREPVRNATDETQWMNPDFKGN